MNRARVVVFAAGVILAACQYVKPACTVIDVMDDACEYVTVRYRDAAGAVREQRIPKREIAGMAAAKASAERGDDGGAR